MWSEVRAHWRLLGPQMTARWPFLTEADIEVARGQRSQLIALVELHCQLEDGEVADQVDAFVRSLQVLAL